MSFPPNKWYHSVCSVLYLPVSLNNTLWRFSPCGYIAVSGHFNASPLLFPHTHVHRLSKPRVQSLRDLQTYCLSNHLSVLLAEAAFLENFR